MNTKLSVNINKIATLRNSRGGAVPNVVKTAIDIEKYGADGITVHPRPDERHITYEDVRELSKVVTTEFNIEGNPKEDKFVKLVLEVLPTQVTLVPDSNNQLTSNHGWDTIKEAEYLKEIVTLFKKVNIRVSIFVDPVISMIEGAKACGADRVELYTEQFAKQFAIDKEAAVAPYKLAAQKALELGLGLNAGHDLDLNNLQYLKEQLIDLAEVSIGHALISDALYLGLHNTVQQYKRQLNP